jgi:hypothetical protein
MPAMLDEALRYAAMGWYVFPLATSGDLKAPHPVVPNGHNDASTDPNVIRRWWSRHPTAGIGVSLAQSGLIVVDIDPRSGGTETMIDLERQHGPLGAAVVCVSGSGGQHRYFRPPGGLSSPPGRLGPRGGGVDLKYRGYVVAPPSPWTPDKSVAWAEGGVRYRWAPGAAPFDGRANWLSRIPDWTLIRDNGTPAVSAAPEEDDPFADVTPIVGLSPDAIQAYLADVENEGDQKGGLPYDDWFAVLAGVYHETDGSAEGREIAWDWSASSPKHEATEFDKTWRSLNIAGKGRAPITFRYVMKLAKAVRERRAQAAETDIRAALRDATTLTALRAAASRIKPLDIDVMAREALTAVVRERYRAITGSLLPVGTARDLVRYERGADTDLPPWLRGWVYCARDDRFFRAGTAETITTRAFDALFSVEMLTAQDRAEGRAVPDTRPSDAALNLYQIPRVHGRMYLPGEAKFFAFQGSRFLNSYSNASLPDTPPSLTAEGRAAAETVERHFEHLIADERDRRLVVSWLCSLVQGGPRPNWSLVIQGPEGDGKSFLVALMGAVLGSENVSVLLAQTIQESAFNGWAEGSQLTVIEEVKQHSQNRHVVLDRLQPLITNDVIQVHRKGVDPYPARNTTAYLLLTNHRDALPVSAGDTRYFLVASPRQTKTAVDEFNRTHPGYFDRLFRTLDEAPGAIRRWMLDHPLDPEFKARTRAPKSREHAHALAISRPGLFVEIEDILAESPDPLVSRDILVVSRLLDILGEHGVPAVEQAVGRALLTMGFSRLGRARDKDGTRQTLWSADPGALGGTPEEQLAAASDRL